MKNYILLLILVALSSCIMSQRPSKQPCCNICGNLGFGVWGDVATNGNITEYYPVADINPAKEDQFGSCVSMSGGFAIVGAPGDNIGAHTKQGSANIYHFNGTYWILMQKLSDPAGITNQFYGASVSISGNYAIVGALGDMVGSNASQGSAIIYHYNGTNWVFMQKLTDATGGAADFFGVSVSISGNYAIIGAYGHDESGNADQGSASIYLFNGTSWVLMNRLTNQAGAANDFFGMSVSISGNYAVIGAPGDTDEGSIYTKQGSASMYRYDGSNWIFVNKVTDGTASSNEDFGHSVSLWGDYAVIGADSDDNGIIHGGSSSVFHYNGSFWESMQKLTNLNGVIQDRFGKCVFISGNYIIVGANFTHPGGPLVEQGAAGIYQRVGLGWQRLQYVTDPGGNPYDQFGSGAAIDKATKRFIIGALGFANFSGKVVFGKIN